MTLTDLLQPGKDVDFITEKTPKQCTQAFIRIPLHMLRGGTAIAAMTEAALYTFAQLSGIDEATLYPAPLLAGSAGFAIGAIADTLQYCNRVLQKFGKYELHHSN